MQTWGGALTAAAAACAPINSPIFDPANASPVDPCTILSGATARSLVGDFSQPTGTQKAILRQCRWRGPRGELEVIVLPRSSHLTSDPNASFNSSTYAAPDAQPVNVPHAERAVIVPRVYPLDEHRVGATLDATFENTEIKVSLTAPEAVRQLQDVAKDISVES